MNAIRLFLLIEGASFVAAALTHFGILVNGYEHHKAGTAETVIGTVLLAGLIVTWIRPQSTRFTGLVVQGFALLGTFVGLFTIAIGVGPRTAPDLIYHCIIIVILVLGLFVAWRKKI